MSHTPHESARPDETVLPDTAPKRPLRLPTPNRPVFTNPAIWSGPAGMFPATCDRIVLTAMIPAPKLLALPLAPVDADDLRIPYSGVLCIHAADEIALNPGQLDVPRGVRPERESTELEANTPLTVDDE